MQYNIEFLNELPTLEELKFLRNSVGWGVKDDVTMKNSINNAIY